MRWYRVILMKWFFAAFWRWDLIIVSSTCHCIWGNVLSYVIWRILAHGLWVIDLNALIGHRLGDGTGGSNWLKVAICYRVIILMAYDNYIGSISFLIFVCLYYDIDMIIIILRRQLAFQFIWEQWILSCWLFDGCRFRARKSFRKVHCCGLYGMISMLMFATIIALLAIDWSFQRSGIDISRIWKSRQGSLSHCEVLVVWAYVIESQQTLPRWIVWSPLACFWCKNLQIARTEVLEIRHNSRTHRCCWPISCSVNRLLFLSVMINLFNTLKAFLPCIALFPSQSRALLRQYEFQRMSIDFWNIFFGVGPTVNCSVFVVLFIGLGLVCLNGFCW